MKFETLNVVQAAFFLKIHPQTLRERAKNGEIPAAKPGKQWIFLKDDLVQYVRSQYGNQRPRSQVQQGDSLCCSSDLIRATGGANSPHQTEVAYKSLLKR